MVDKRQRDREYARNRYAQDPEYRERSLARSRAYYLKHQDELKAKRRDRYATDSEFRTRHINYAREHRLKVCYGLTLEEYHARLNEQRGRCGICGLKPRYWLFVDHCHQTGKTRGLLCRICNSAVGFCRDDQAIARKVAAYVEYWRRLHTQEEERPAPPALVNSRKRVTKPKSPNRQETPCPPPKTDPTTAKPRA
jgi:hypothetical protein